MRDVQKDILNFWFVETQPQQWFQKNPDFDAQIKGRFAADFDLAMEGVYDRWYGTPDGALALIILLDQFPRNMFRDDARAYSGDEKALTIARHGVAKQLDQIVEPVKRRFFYLPFEHSENLADQEKSVSLFEAMKEEDPLGYDYAVKHLEVIQRFGRFPHRNAVLGRDNTADEEAYLADPNAGF